MTIPCFLINSSASALRLSIWELLAPTAASVLTGVVVAHINRACGYCFRSSSTRPGKPDAYSLFAVIPPVHPFVDVDQCSRNIRHGEIIVQLFCQAPLSGGDRRSKEVAICAVGQWLDSLNAVP